jgi:hypothetical protein
MIDLENSPFVNESWMKQDFGFTSKRQKQIKNLVGKGIKAFLLSKSENEIRYDQLIAIRRGFVKIVNRKFFSTEKWNNR